MADRPYQVELPDALEESIAVEINKEIESLKLSLSILQDNYEELIKEHERIEQADLVEQNGIKLLKKNYFTYLHNYTASVYTLINHSLRIVNKFGDEDFTEQYSEELRERELDKKGAFLQQIRHYMQKRKLPPVKLVVTWDDSVEEYSTDLLLKKSMMMDWNGWTSDVKEYLETLADSVPIRQEIKEYQEEVVAFYDWFFKYIKLYFKEEFESAKTIVEQIEEYKEGRMGYPKEFVLPFKSDDFEV
jgi:hypothetical protein